jgi:hypothetical protein
LFLEDKPEFVWHYDPNNQTGEGIAYWYRAWQQTQWQEAAVGNRRQEVSLGTLSVVAGIAIAAVLAAVLVGICYSIARTAVLCQQQRRTRKGRLTKGPPA